MCEWRLCTRAISEHADIVQQGGNSLASRRPSGEERRSTFSRSSHTHTKVKSKCRFKAAIAPRHIALQTHQVYIQYNITGMYMYMTPGHATGTHKPCTISRIYKHIPWNRVVEVNVARRSARAFAFFALCAVNQYLVLAWRAFMLGCVPKTFLILFHFFS